MPRFRFVALLLKDILDLTASFLNVQEFLFRKKLFFKNAFLLLFKNSLLYIVTRMRFAFKVRRGEVRQNILCICYLRASLRRT